MKRFSEQFKKQSDPIHMRVSERNALRERVLSYMEYHPLPAELREAKRVSAGIASEPFKTIRLNSFYLRSFAGVFSVFLIFGVSIIAERSVPGDFLYPVKVQINEEVRSSLSLSPYAKVAWETERLERRITEARLLASEGKLTNEAQEKVAQAVKSHTDAAQREIAHLRESDSDEAAIAGIAFASALAVQSEVLESHNANADAAPEEGSKSVVALAQVVAQARDTAEASQSGVMPSYDKLLGRVEAESTSIYELFASVKRDASAQEAANVERRLADIERKIAKATALKEGTNTAVQTETMMLKADFSESTTTNNVSNDVEVSLTQDDANAEAQAEAVEVLRSALADIQKLMNYMTHIDVRENVSLEELVPVTLTPEEQQEEATRLLDEIILMQTQVSSKAVDENRAEKIALGLQELEIKVAAAVDLMSENNYEAAVLILSEAHILAEDLDRLTQHDEQKEPPVLAPTTDGETATSSEEDLQ